VNEPATIGSMQYAGMRRILVGDGFPEDDAKRAVAAFAAAGIDIWMWVTAWVAEREFQAGRDERAEGTTSVIGEPPWLPIPPPPPAIAEAERGRTARCLHELEQWSSELSEEQRAKLAAILGLPEATPIELVRWAGELLRIALDAQNERPS
jgi:hypothetical protein